MTAMPSRGGARRVRIARREALDAQEVLRPPAEGLQVLRGEARVRGLEGHQAAAVLHSRARKDPAAPHLGHLRAAPAEAADRDQAGAIDRPASVRHGLRPSAGSASVTLAEPPHGDPDGSGHAARFARRAGRFLSRRGSRPSCWQRSSLLPVRGPAVRRARLAFRAAFLSCAWRTGAARARPGGRRAVRRVSRARLRPGGGRLARVFPRRRSWRPVVGLPVLFAAAVRRGTPPSSAFLGLCLAGGLLFIGLLLALPLAGEPPVSAGLKAALRREHPSGARVVPALEHGRRDARGHAEDPLRGPGPRGAVSGRACSGWAGSSAARSRSMRAPERRGPHRPRSRRGSRPCGWRRRSRWRSWRRGPDSRSDRALSGRYRGTCCSSWRPCISSRASLSSATSLGGGFGRGSCGSASTSWRRTSR